MIEITKPTFGQVIAEAAVSRLVEATKADGKPDRAMASAMLTSALAVMAALDGRAHTASVLRELADGLDKPKPVGWAYGPDSISTRKR